MYSFETAPVSDEDLILKPNIGVDVQTIGIGSGMIPIDDSPFYTGDDPNGLVLDVDLWIVGDADGEPLPPSFSPQCGLRQTVGAVTEETTLYYGNGSDVEEKPIWKTSAYSGAITKDKTFAFVPSAPYRHGETRSIEYDVEMYYVVSWTYYQPLYEVGRVYGKKMAHAVFYDTYVESFMPILTRAGILEFYDLSLMGLKKNNVLKTEMDNYLATLNVIESDRYFVDLVTYGDDLMIGLLINGDAIKIGFTWDGHLEFTETYHDVKKVLPSLLLYSSIEMMWDGMNNLFIPLMSDGVSNLIVDAWAIPSVASDFRYIKHYADGSFTLAGSPITVTGVPFDFIGNDDAVYAVYRDAPYRLELVAGTGESTLHVNNYSYFDSKMDAQVMPRLCSETTTDFTYQEWVEANYTSIEEFYDKPPCPYRYSRSGYPERAGSDNGIELLAFQGSSIKSIADGVQKVIRGFASDDAYFAYITESSVANDEIDIFDIQETVTPPIQTFGGAFNEYREKWGVQEDTKEWFTWADVRNLRT